MNGHSRDGPAQRPAAAEASSSTHDQGDDRDEMKNRLVFLPEQDGLPMYVCAQCGTQLALQDELISKSFSGRAGKAYLFHSSINTTLGTPEDRHLLTGLHTVADLKCKGCEVLVGWAYLKAYEASQKYKEGRQILECCSIQKNNHWR